MNALPIERRQIVTDRLVLRPTSVLDADRAFEIQSDWQVTQMLRMASFPPERAQIREWFSDHEREWAEGTAYRFAVELRGEFVGIADIDEISEAQGELGYWFDRSCWGHGYAFEAAQAVVDFAFSSIGLTQLRSGHAADNSASGKVLLKLGFRSVGTQRVASLSRGQDIQHECYELRAPTP
uniref:GNAT family N-acetyltransferase n=1 Tax=Bosea sp. NBC_00436 TaxID=2969620 RepID=A0A9E7ZUZ3_9HYPH